MKNTILCVKWGDKYSREYVEKLKQQCEDNCSVPFNFYCLTDKKEKDYDILLPTTWDEYEGLHSRFRNQQAPSNMWAYRKLYMFQLSQNEFRSEQNMPTGGWDESIRAKHSEKDFKSIKGDNFLYLDLDVIIHQDLTYFFTLEMKQPWIVRGWWNDMNECRKNYATMQSTPINSSVIRWTRGQLTEIYKHIAKNLDVLFFTYPTIDNYLNHFWYNMWHETNNHLAENLFNVFPEGDIYSYYTGNIFPSDMEQKKLRPDHKICLFNNSADTNDVEELKSLW
jgi:hypothetical protein